MTPPELPYVFLALAVLAGFIRGRRVRLSLSLVLLFLATGAALNTGALLPAGIVCVALALGLAVAIHQDRLRPKRPALRLLIHGSWILFACLMAVHRLPGFQNMQLLRGFRLSPDSLPYSLYLNFDKPLLGLAVLLWVATDRSRDWRRILGWGLGVGALSAGLLLGFAWGAGFVRWEPKFPDWGWIWLASNLLFTCVSEEAFFRGYLQEAGAKFPWTWPAVSVLFGLAHFPAGPWMVAFASLAGLAYGWAYCRSGGRIEAAVMAHFTFNTTHFLLFSYPALEAGRHVAP